MKDIDFLPQRYRRDRAGHTAAVWRIVALTGLSCLLACAWYLDVSKRRRLEQQLADASRQYEQMLALASQASTLKSELTAVNAQAELWTYLRHPWPKTQILATVAQTLPEALSLDEVRIDRDETAPAAQIGLLRDAAPARQGAEAATDLRTGAQRDLARLQALCDAHPVLVLLRGTTTNMAELHTWLAIVGRAPLFSKAELVSLEQGPTTSHQVYRFVARLVVRPGYGQPQGPATHLPEIVSAPSHHRHANFAGTRHGTEAR